MDTGSDRAALALAQERTSVTATALGSWPGQEAAEAMRVIRGELGAPHLPHLVQLPDRGVGADAVGRTAALLLELPVDVQPHGWRLVDRPGKDYRRALSWLAADVNILAETIGTEETGGGELKIQLRGPLSMAANLSLHNGERALRDAGARREILQSLTAGMVEHLQKVAEVSRGARMVVQLDEPEVDRVLTGRIPTASGFRTLRAVAEQEVLAAWRTMAEAARAAGAVEVAVIAPVAGAPLEKTAEAGLDAVGVPAAELSPARREAMAEMIERDQRWWAGVLPTSRPHADVPQVSEIVDAVVRPWQELGLPLGRLVQVRLTPSSGLAGYSPAAARKVLERLTQAASALNDVAAQ